MNTSPAALAPSYGNFIREDTSPDGRWRIAYDHDGGERSPLIASPRVIEIATQRVWLDLWRSNFEGTVRDFSPRGFRLTVRDPYYPLEASVVVDAVNETFVLENPPTPPQPIAQCSVFVRSLMNHAREDYRVRNTPPPLPPGRW